MEHVRWTSRPNLHRPVLIAAFEGWNDAGDASSNAVRWLHERWGAEPFAFIDPEEFFDFSATRPRVRLDEGHQREIVWPAFEFSTATIPGTDTEVVLLLGTEPQLRWRTFSEQVVAVADACGVRLAITLGALLADVSHAAPVSVIGTAYDPDVVGRLGLTQSSYEGPTGIVGVLHDALARAGVDSASLWAAVPSYVPSAPSPKAPARAGRADRRAPRHRPGHDRPRDRVGELRAAGHRAGRGRRRHRGLRPAPRGGAGGGGRPGRLRRRGRALPARSARFLKLAGPLGRPGRSVTGVGTTMAVMVRRARRQDGRGADGSSVSMT